MSLLQVARHERLGPTSIPICSCCYSPQAFVRPPTALPLPVHQGKLRRIPLAALEQNYTGYRYTRKGRSRPVVAHRDGRRLDGQPSLSGHCGHGPIFIAQRSVSNDPLQTWGHGFRPSGLGNAPPVIQNAIAEDQKSVLPRLPKHPASALMYRSLYPTLYHRKRQNWGAKESRRSLFTDLSSI